MATFVSIRSGSIRQSWKWMFLKSDASLWCNRRSVLGPIVYSMYTVPLADITSRHRMQFHFYANDSQVCLSFKPWANGEPACSKYRIELCNLYKTSTSGWKLTNWCPLNNNKTELLVLNSRHRPPPPLNNLRQSHVWFDNILYMDKQINK